VSLGEVEGGEAGGEWGGGGGRLVPPFFLTPHSLHTSYLPLSCWLLYNPSPIHGVLLGPYAEVLKLRNASASLRSAPPSGTPVPSHKNVIEPSLLTVLQWMGMKDRFAKNSVNSAESLISVRRPWRSRDGERGRFRAAWASILTLNGGPWNTRLASSPCISVLYEVRSSALSANNRWPAAIGGEVEGEGGDG